MSTLAAPDRPKFGRRTWRSKGIRLNTDAPLDDVTITDSVLSSAGAGSPGTVDVRVGEWRGSKVAVKTLRSPDEEELNAKSPEESSLEILQVNPYNRRLLQETHLLGQLRHPHVAQVFGLAYDAQNRPAVVSELLIESLRQRIAFSTRFTFRDIVDISLEVLSGLSYLHTLPHPVVHGSVSSTNVLFTVDGTVKLTDANLAMARLSSPLTPIVSMIDDRDGSQSSSFTKSSPFSATSMLYQPAYALAHDSYELEVDCSAFVVLLMALCLHCEPKPLSPIDHDGKKRSESERREADLKELSAYLPNEAANIVKSTIGDIEMRHATVSEDTEDGETDVNPEQAVSMDGLRQRVEGLKSTQEYRRSAITRGCPAANGMRQQSELEAAIRRLQDDVAETLKVAEQAFKAEEAELRRRMGVAEEAVRAQKEAMGRKLRTAQEEISRLQDELEAEKRCREDAEAEMELKQMELDTLKAPLRSRSSATGARASLSMAYKSIVDMPDPLLAVPDDDMRSRSSLSTAYSTGSVDIPDQDEMDVVSKSAGPTSPLTYGSSIDVVRVLEYARIHACVHL